MHLCVRLLGTMRDKHRVPAPAFVASRTFGDCAVNASRKMQSFLSITVGENGFCINVLIAKVTGNLADFLTSDLFPEPFDEWSGKSVQAFDIEREIPDNERFLYFLPGLSSFFIRDFHGVEFLDFIEVEIY